MRSVAIVGSGPSGLFLAKNLFKLLKKDIKIDIYEKMNAPFGLLKYGVAPDHPEIKKKFLSHFKPLFQEAGESLSLYLDADIGNTIQVETLKAGYDAVALCTGMSNSKRNWPLIPGSFGADQIVGWYNNAPEFKNLQLDLQNVSNVVIVGNGNVAIDIVRILAKPAALLENTDINPVALEELKRSKVKRITVLGRRGPLEMSFTPAELRELVALKDSVEFWSSELKLDVYLKEGNTRIQDKNIKILQTLLDRNNRDYNKPLVDFHFFSPISAIDMKSPPSICTINKSPTNKFNYMDHHNFDLLIECIGFYQKNIVYGPYQDSQGKIKVEKGHHVDSNVFACGWAQTGPKGTIVDSMIEAERCANEILEHFVTDASSLVDTIPVPRHNLRKWVPEFE